MCPARPSNPGICSKSVYNLSTLTRGEAALLLATVRVLHPQLILPDGFREYPDGPPLRVLVEGKLLEDGHFLATNVLPLRHQQGYTLQGHNRTVQGAPFSPSE